MNLDVSQREFREKIMDCFRTELASHLATLVSGLDALDAGNLAGEERATTLHVSRRAAHTMKGAARAVGVTIVEQMARSLENVLYAIETGTLTENHETISACRQVIEAIRVVRVTYENQEVIPPEAATVALLKLDEIWNPAIALKGIKP